MPISFAHGHDSGPNAGLVNFRRRKLVHIVARVSVVFMPWRCFDEHTDFVRERDI